MPSLKERIYNLGIDVIAFFKTALLALSLPFKFLQFWKDSWKENSEKGKR